MQKIKVSVVSYLNSKPFIYGLEHSGIKDLIDLQLDIPSVCAQKLIDGEVDLGLVPVAVIPKLQESHIIGDYCIGAVGKVASVMLYSDVPLSEIESVLLDYHSRTSVTLVQVLAREYWKINPNWVKAGTGFEDKIEAGTAGVIIGDRTFGLEGKYRYAFDLSEEWQKFTGLPFVFACWVANRELPREFITEFNQALETGLKKRPQLIKQIEAEGTYKTDIGLYLNKSISYELDEDKKKALELFLSYLS
ncbi:MAG TPA: menaquinone biosynthesis protein [Bacteroidia bacterium]|jgi:chorismate dehydratase